MTSLCVLLGLVLRAAPASLAERPQPGGMTETVAERQERMRDIVADAWHVARILPPFPGRSREGSAIDFLAVIAHESTFRLDVDSGKCSKDPREGDCDGGRALCLAQIHPATDEERAEVTGSRIGCFTAAWRRLRGSLRACTEYRDGGLAMFTGGQCDDEKAVSASRAHMITVQQWRARVPAAAAACN